MTRPGLGVLLVALWLVLAGAGGDARFVDTALAEVEGRLVTASDVALARALGLFGLSPSSAPIAAEDAERLLRAWLVVGEARRLGIGEGQAEADEAARAATARLGADAAFRAWLERAGVEAAWASAMVAEDARWRRFVELRFRAFVFVSEDKVSAALGPGRHGPAERRRTREALRERETEQRLAAWLDEVLERSSVRRLLPPGARVPCPLPMPERG